MTTIKETRRYECPNCTTSFTWEIGRDDDGLPYIKVACLVSDREVLRAQRRYFHEAFLFMREWHDECGGSARLDKREVVTAS